MNRSWIVVFAFSLFAPASAAELLPRQGKYIRLTTDLPSAEAETLVASFDAAVPQWIAFWGLSLNSVDDWMVDAYVAREKSELRRRGLLPRGVPDFPFGYALGNKLWVIAQQSEYYTRHLLLHEGAHSLAFHLFGGAGPTWYMEGTAELLATHRGQGGDTVINRIPLRREDVPYWGRFKRISELRSAAQIPTLETVLAYKPNLKGDVKEYGCSWSAALLLSGYPEYRTAFRSAAEAGRDSGPGFNAGLRRKLDRDWPVVAARWRLMTEGLDYGFDPERERVELSVNDPLWDGKPIHAEVAPDRGWQSIGVRIPKGARIKLSPAGRVTLDDQPKPWISEPPGVTIRYSRGRPIGQLLMCLLPNAIESGTTQTPLPIQAVAAPTKVLVKEHSWLLLRVNDDVTDLGNNTGSYTVEIERT